MVLVPQYYWSVLFIKFMCVTVDCDILENGAKVKSSCHTDAATRNEKKRRKPKVSKDCTLRVPCTCHRDFGIVLECILCHCFGMVFMHR